MKFFHRRSLSTKLTVLIMGCSIIMLFVVSLAFLALDTHQLRQEMLRDLSVQAEMLGLNNAAPLMFDDIKTAQENLAALKSNPTIVRAALYDDEGREFAVYPLDAVFHRPSMGDIKDGHMLRRSRLIVRRRVVMNEEVLGAIYVEADLSVLMARSLRLSLLIGAIFVGALPLAYILAGLFQRVVSRRITDLTELMTQISKTNNYALRFPPGSEDEIGVLISGFNAMLTRIEQSTQELQQEIEDRVQAEKALRETRNYLNNVFQSMHSMLLSVDRQGMITQWNMAAEKALHISEHRAVGESVFELLPFLKPHEALLYDAMNRRAPRTIHHLRMPLDEVVRYLDVAISPLTFNGVVGAVVRMDDVTDVVQKNQQLLQAQKMEMVGNLAGGLAHDFNNVLGGIIGTVSLMKYTFEERDLNREEVVEQIDMIERAADRASDLVQQLLALSSRREMKTEVFDLSVVVDNVLKICQNTFEKNIAIEHSEQEERALISGDVAHIEQVLLNLCVNAMHAMTIMRDESEPRGGELTVSVRHAHADEHFCRMYPDAREGDYWVLGVRDTGVGMTTDVKERIFDPFFTTKANEKGTGLGLAMVYNIVREHGGFIHVYSEPGQGTLFSVYLPQSTETSETNDRENPVDKLLHGQGVILVVDDDEVILKTAQGILRECGYEVLSASTPEEGRDVFDRHQTRMDLAIVDMAMQTLQGDDLFMRLRHAKPDLPILVTSGFRKSNKMRALQKCRCDFIQKPFTAGQLAKTVHDLLNP